MHILNPNQIIDTKPGESRVIVIGSGAIGLYAAGLLARRGRQVVVIEAGGTQLSRFEEESYQSVGRIHAGIRLGRSRNLGGTSALWGGQLVEFTPIDFAGRAWLPNSKWPVSYEEIAAYYPPTYRNLGIPDRFIRDEEIWNGISAIRPDLGSDFEVFLTRWMAIPNFAELFAKEIRSNPRLMVLTGYAATGFRGRGGVVASVRIADNNGESQWIDGDQFILAAGTIENARLLLHCAQDNAWVAPWKENKNVGRFFQDHLGGRLGTFSPADKKNFFKRFSNIVYAGSKFQPKIRMRNEVQGRQRIYGIQGIFAFENKFSEHMVFLKQFLRAVLYSHQLNGLGDMLRKSAGIARLAIPLMWNYIWEHRIFVPSTSKTFLIAQVEHASRAESSIRVDYQFTDSRGLPRVILDWQLAGDELSAIRDFAMQIGAALRTSGIGELIIDDNLLALNSQYLAEMRDTNHQAGGAIMATTAEKGVVDCDLRVFGTENLYVGGASVFPTASHANVTFTALTFITRLVDHLTGRPYVAKGKNSAERLDERECVCQ